jgi:hypothetical protein
MPIVELPDGNSIDFPDTMSGDQINAAVRKHLGTDAPPPTQAPPRDTPLPSFGGDVDTMMASSMAQGMGEPDPRPLREVITDAAGRYGEGFGGGLTKASAAMERTRDRNVPDQYRLTPEQTSEVNRRSDQTLADADAYAKRAPSLGVPGMLGEMTPEVLASMYPIARAGTSLLPLATRMLGKRAAPFVADVAANAGYEGAKGYATNSPTPFMDALKGAGGAAAGRVVGNVAGRALGGITDDAATLLKAGITPTYGQAFGAGGIVDAMERTLQKLPLAGAAVDAAKRRAKGQYPEAEIDAALKATGIPHEGAGFKAVQQVNDAISDSYNNLKPHIELPFFSRPQAVNDAVAQIKNDLPLLSGENATALNKLIQQRVLNRAGNPLDRLDGAAFKDIDREIGEAVRSRLTGTPTANDREMARALQILQTNIRARVAPVANAAPEVMQQLQATNLAYKRMVPINIATAHATGGAKGQFSPDQFAAAAKQAKVPAYDPRMALNTAARETLNESGTGLGNALSRNIGVPGVGAGMHFAATALGVPHEALLAGEAAVALGGTGVAHALYTEPGIRMVLGAMNLIPSTAKWIVNQPFVKQQEFVHRMLVESPATTKKVLAQVGAHLAARQPQGVQ